jgi:hypothetical protein
MTIIYRQYGKFNMQGLKANKPDVEALILTHNSVKFWSQLE